ncbi:MAG: hypothetical protein L6R37_004537 [Teloschistes peruensis]|nr:MAG: hypothetical protein L6R37_004537 [Teloschistes peruensis]
MAYGGQAGLLDLEKELTCSASASKPNPFTCPSCRASVRETRPNATVTTLLDMYLQANPGRGRTQEEKDELEQKYRNGEQVLPKVQIQRNDPDDERMLAEVREMSLREVGVRGPGSYERGMRHRTADRRRDTNEEPSRRRQAQQGSAETGSFRQIGHQASLRSIMSNSEIDSSEMEEEILRLVDEGWLDGIDLDNLDTSQVDELSERIADAYRRRHRQRSRQVNAPAEESRRPRARLLSHLTPPTRLYRDLVSSKHTQYLLATNVEHQANSEGRLLHRPVHPRDRYPPGTYIRLLARQLTYQRDHQAQDLIPDPTNRSAKIEGSATKIIAAPKGRLKACGPPRPVVLLCLEIVKICPSCAIGVAPETYSTIRTGTARDVTMGSTISAYNAIGSVEDVFTGMASGMQRCSVIKVKRKTIPGRKLFPRRTALLDISIDVPNRKLAHCLSPSNHYVSLTLSTQCDICEQSIAPSTTRFHCPQCNEGDYNICTESYLNLISTNRISRDNGDKGWRRCPSGHRVIIIAFEDSSAGQRRIIVKDRVGGHALRKDTGSNDNNAPRITTHELSWQDGDGQQRVRTLVSKQPLPREESASLPQQTDCLPSGGSGTRALALWAYWPEDPSPDDLSFPRGAEIVEVENVNGDWFVGWYGGREGVFPGGYVRVL